MFPSIPSLLVLFRNRLPNHFDDLSYWSDVLLWREQHFRTIIKAYDGSSHGEQVYYCFNYYVFGLSVFITQTNQAMIAVHHLASGITQFSSVARKQKLSSVSLESLSR